MKKYFSIFAGVAALLLSSCSNDDLPIGQSVTFKVNPSTVVSDLLEFSAGDLSSVDSDHKVYVSLYIYNSAGTLIAKDEQKFQDYTHIMNSVLSLGEGDYIAVTSTRIEADNGFKYWDFTGTDNLSTFTVTDEGYIGGSDKILGLSAKKIHIGDSTADINLNVECAGAVALVRVMDWNRYSDVSGFGLLGNKTCESVVLDNNGNLNYSVESSSNYGWWLAKWSYDSSYSGAYGYTFLFPSNNIKMSFAAIDEDGYYVTLGNSCLADIERGHTYYFAYDVQKEENTWSDYTTRANNMDGLTKDGSSLELKIDSEKKTLSFIQ